MVTEPGRPLLLLDVDGPLNPYAARWFTTRVARDGYVFHDVGPVGGFASLRVALHPQHGRWLREPATADDGFDLVWATTWRHEANRVLAPLLQLPPDLPVIDLVPDHRHIGRHSWKTDRIADWVGPRPFAWIDDEINRHTRSRLGGFPWLGPHLALRIEPHQGLGPADVERLRAFARLLTA